MVAGNKKIGLILLSIVVTCSKGQDIMLMFLKCKLTIEAAHLTTTNNSENMFTILWQNHKQIGRSL